LAPTRSGYSNAGTSLYYLGRFDAAAAMYQKALELAPDDYQMWGNLGDARSQSPGGESDAGEAYRKALKLGEGRLRINPTDSDTKADLALYHAALGLPEQARKLSSESLEQDPGNMYVHFNAALVHVRLGEPEPALADLERAVELGYPRQLLPGDAGLKSLRPHPRFVALVARRSPAAPAAPNERGGQQ
jgi:tetratricopeptide (TPR) repeat protein